MNREEFLKGLDIRQFKLSNGEEIIAYVADATEEYFFLETPLQVNYDVENYYFTRWMSLAEDSINVVVMYDKIISTAQCTESIKVGYIKAVTKFEELFGEVTEEEPELDPEEPINKTLH